VLEGIRHWKCLESSIFGFAKNGNNRLEDGTDLGFCLSVFGGLRTLTVIFSNPFAALNYP
jgi:hypothetical protein